MTKTIRVTVTQHDGRWALFLSDTAKDASTEPFGEGEGIVFLNKSISSYLRLILAMIEDDLPE